MENKCCHSCDGRGFHRDNRLKDERIIINCPTCHGTGQVSNDSFMQLLFWAGIGLMLALVAVMAAT